uniref:phospholipase A1 n=1 Tax=Trichogramma kaykai TaxID=54128 RepID=A0ABD2WJM7_9HYME
MASDLQVPLKNWTYLHFIGHSLGAHVVGQAARLLKMSNHRPAVHRITGLDPANPCFNDVKVAFRLRKSDARFVDIIHTNSAPGLNPNFGLYDRIGTFVFFFNIYMFIHTFFPGHVDFYINGGNNQPSCATRFLPANIPFLSDPGDLIEDLESFLENNFIGLLGQFSSNLSKIDTRRIVANFSRQRRQLIGYTFERIQLALQTFRHKHRLVRESKMIKPSGEPAVGAFKLSDINKKCRKKIQ